MSTRTERSSNSAAGDKSGQIDRTCHGGVQKQEDEEADRNRQAFEIFAGD